MEMVKLNSSLPAMSRLVYGVWRLADDENGSTAHVRAKIDACLEQGITTFDHADIYGEYQCEALFGRALAEDPSLRDQMQIITKCDIAIPTSLYPERRVKLRRCDPATNLGVVALFLAPLLLVAAEVSRWLYSRPP